MNMFKSALMLVCVSQLAACASGPKTTHFTEDKVVGRSDSLSARPAWASETRSVHEEDGKISFVGMAEVPGDSRSTAAFRVSDANAKASIAAKIETDLLRVVQSADTGLGIDDQQLKSMVSEVSHVTFTNIDVRDRYWEKVVKTKSNGEEQLIMKAFSLIQLTPEQLKKAVLDHEANGKGSREAQTKLVQFLQNHWDGGITQ